jgi:hypothetical protein
MLRFKQYLNESSLSKAELMKPAGSGPNSGRPRYEIFADKIWNGEDHILNNGDTIVIKTITMGGNEYKSSNSKDKQKFIDLFAETDGAGITISDPKTAWGNVAKTPEYGGKGGGEKISENTQELMTAAIIMLGKKYDESEITVEDAAKIIEDAKGQWSKIVGVEGKDSLLNQFTNNWYDLATAISSSNAILDIMKGKPVKVFWTGKDWDKEIEVFNPAVGGVKDYNSSDIVVKGSDGIYYGFSLKKKGSSKDADPTLINKPITGKKSLLKPIVGQDYETIEKAKEMFFTEMIASYYSKKFGKRYSVIRKLSDKERGTLIRKIPNDFANDMLRGRGSKKNIFWSTVDKVISKHPKDFVENFLKLVFRLELEDMLKGKPFKFYLLTGIGKQKGDTIGVEKAEVKDLPSTVEIMTNIFKENKLKLGRTLRTKGNKSITLRQPWEYDKTETAPAKLFYTIYNGEIPILNLELRYKGSKTAEPQFQAVATALFKNMFKK